MQNTELIAHPCHYMILITTVAQKVFSVSQICRIPTLCDSDNKEADYPSFSELI